MRYLVLSQSSEKYAFDLSAAFYTLSRPSAKRSENDITQYYASWVTHPITRSVALGFPDGDSQPIDPAADPTPLLNLVSPIMSATELADLDASIRAARGKRILTIDLLPARFQAALQDESALDADGWFPRP